MYLTKLTIAAFITLSSFTHAYALSCASQGFDFNASVARHKAENKNMKYLVGSFISPAPKRKGKQVFEARFIGSEIGQRTKDIKGYKINVSISCIANWCGAIPGMRKHTIAAVEVHTSGKLHLNAGPCNPNTFDAKSALNNSIKN